MSPGKNAPGSDLARDDAKDRDQEEQVAQQIELYKSAGSITDQQMQDLHMGVARLDEASRSRVLSHLMRAINSGQIKMRR